ncbi:MAG: DUF1016 N-terminal domain-containing protein [Candidatus Scalindua sp.]|nr:DUF1016 N-terminal domain-containing protein [Candidatus Scalindua sp.]
MGRHIADKQKDAKWFEGFLKQLSIDLMVEFPDMKDFSLSNLKYIKQWYTLLEFENSQQALAYLTQIPWGHNIVIISKCKNPDEDITCISETYHKWRYEPTLSPSQEGNITSGSFQVENVSSFPSQEGNISLPGKGNKPHTGKRKCSCPGKGVLGSREKSLPWEGGSERREGCTGITGFCNSVTMEKVRELDYVLTPGRYVGLPDDEDDFDFNERFTTLKKEFEEQLKEEARLNKRIDENLKKIKINE